MSGSEDIDPFFRSFFPDLFIYPRYDANALKGLLRRQFHASKYLANPYALYVADDIADTPADLKNRMFSAIFKRGRHFNMMFILALQYALDLSMSMRACVDYCFILREKSLEIRERLYRNFGSAIPSQSVFNDLMDQLTDDHTAMVIVNRSKENDLASLVFYYKADPDGMDGFKFGCKELWEWHDMRYNTSFVQKPEVFGED